MICVTAPYTVHLLATLLHYSSPTLVLPNLFFLSNVGPTRSIPPLQRLSYPLYVYFSSPTLVLPTQFLLSNVGPVLDTTSRTSEDECRWQPVPNDLSPEINNTMKHGSCFDCMYNCCTMHNSTHSVHNRLLKVWRARLPRPWPSCYVSAPPLSEANCQPFPPPGRLGPSASKYGSLFPRIHAYPLLSVRYRSYPLYSSSPC